MAKHQRPPVYWLTRAERRLEQSLAAFVATKQRRTKKYAKRLQTLSSQVAEAFPDAEAIVVRDLLSGFRPKDDLQVLLVESVCPSLSKTTPAPDARGVFIVKIGPTEDLARELAGWQNTCPAGMQHDSILMSLRGAPQQRSAKELPTALVYEDAYQVIGAGDVVPLEQVVLDCCRFGDPAPESIVRVFQQIYDRLGSYFYSRSFVPDVTEGFRNRLAPRLEHWLGDWDTPESAQAEPERIRILREIYGLLSRKSKVFIDPRDYLRSVLRCPQHSPRLLFGCGHGDLHGRNILVSREQGEAVSPAIFDYEDMARDNLVGWDFVKMEVELKIRAIPLAYDEPPMALIESALKFELELAEMTEQLHDRGEVDFKVSGGKRAERLARIVLGLRRQAQLQLGARRQRDREWLEEYYFLLACYGVCGGRYSTYQRKELICAYVSAGVAARRLSRPWNEFDSTIAAAENRAMALLPASPTQEPNSDQLAALDQYDAAADTCEMSHHARFVMATKWSRSRNEPYMRKAVEVLERLKADYPHVLEIDEELALAYLELDQDAEAEAILQSVTMRYRNLHEETYCRIGRVWKQRGEKNVDQSGNVDDPLARNCFQLSQEQYRIAYNMRNDYYAGINVAALYVFLGDNRQAQTTAEEVLQSLEGKNDPGDLHWRLATAGEAYLILEDNGAAEKSYARAVAHPDCDSHSHQTMFKQARLLIARLNHDTKKYWQDGKIESLFGENSQNIPFG